MNFAALLTAVLLGTLPLVNTIDNRGVLALAVTADGDLPKAVYIGIVPRSRPWSEPAIERIVTTGDERTLTLPLPEGEYRVAVGALDYATWRSGVLTISPRDEVRVTAALQKLSTVTGRVLSTTRDPIPNARVGNGAAFVKSFDSLSGLGEQYLRPNVITNTDKDGVFVLPVQTQGRRSVYVEADGYAPAIIGDVTAASNELDDIELIAGATLDAKIGTTSDSAGHQLRLIPRRVTLPDRLRFSTAVAIWSRALMGPLQTWTSLPAGDYDVCIDGRFDYDPRTPFCVATVHLSPGDHGRITVDANRLPTRSSAALRVLLRTKDAVDVAASLAAQCFDSDHQEGLAVEAQSEKDVVVITIPNGCAPNTQCVFTWANGIAFATGDQCTQDVRGSASSSATLHVRTLPGFGSPQRAALLLSSCDDTTHLRAIVPFLLDSRGMATVAVPEGCFEGRLYAKGVGAVRLPRKTFVPRTAIEYPPLQLEPATSIAVRILDDEYRPLADAAVVLRAGRDGELIYTESANGRTDSQGWARVTGVPLGTYTLSVMMPGYRAYVSEPFSTPPSERFFLSNICLTPGDMPSRGL